MYTLRMQHLPLNMIFFIIIMILFLTKTILLAGISIPQGLIQVLFDIGMPILSSLIRTISVYNQSQLNLWSDFFKNTYERVNFQKNCVTCHFSIKLQQRYLSWILTTIFCPLLFQSTSFLELFSVDVSFLFILFPLVVFKTNVVIYICLLKSCLKVSRGYFTSSSKVVYRFWAHEIRAPKNRSSEENLLK